MGAPRDLAGLRRTVMVESVSLRGASDSYSGIMGAEEEDDNQRESHFCKAKPS